MRMPFTIHQPAEWESHRALWTAFPSHAELWGTNLDPARREFSQFCRALADRGETVRVLACGETALSAASELLGEGIDLVEGSFGDIWIRDTGPIFAKDGDGDLVACRFGFNGWGGKYDLPGDREIGEFLANVAGVPVRQGDMILEGGAIDCDGQRTVLTTRECLLNPNRNPGMQEADVEHRLSVCLGVERVIWMDRGLLNDHTDGHIDNLARFVAPGRVVCQHATGAEDPNREVFEEIEKVLRTARDATGRALEVISLPSPGKVLDESGKPAPASHANFLIGNGLVAVPVYGEGPEVDEVLRILADLFPDREVLGFPARHLLTGGGAFHCITQQQPS